MRGHHVPHTAEAKAKMRQAHLGRSTSIATQFKPSAWKFKGSLREYLNLHQRVGRRFGKPTECENCGVVRTGKGMHWANISGNYDEFDRSDWHRLCARCHFHLYGKGQAQCA